MWNNFIASRTYFHLCNIGVVYWCPILQDPDIFCWTFCIHKFWWLSIISTWMRYMLARKSIDTAPFWYPKYCQCYCANKRFFSAVGSKSLCFCCLDCTSVLGSRWWSNISACVISQVKKYWTFLDTRLKFHRSKCLLTTL